jgi:hypothetical protein
VVLTPCGRGHYEGSPGYTTSSPQHAKVGYVLVIANATMANYYEGGGHWASFLQYPLGIKQLGHRVFWLEVMRSSGDREADTQAGHRFFERLAQYGLQDDPAVVVAPNTPMPSLDEAKVFGRSRRTWSASLATPI